METKHYSFQNPDRLLFPIIAFSPLLASLNHYFIQKTASFEEVVIMFAISAVVFTLGMAFFSRKHELQISHGQLQTKKRAYRPEEIRKLQLHPKSGLVVFKLRGYFDSRKLQFDRTCRASAIRELASWAAQNEVVCVEVSKR